MYYQIIQPFNIIHGYYFLKSFCKAINAKLAEPMTADESRNLENEAFSHYG